MNKTPVRDFYGRIKGWIEEDDITKDKIFRDFYGRIVAKYDKKQNITRDFYGRIIGKGDMGVSLLYKD